MPLSTSQGLLMAVAGVFALAGTPLPSSAQTCQTVTTVKDFDVAEYASAPWYIHQQAENTYTPLENSFCVTAQYALKPKPTFWGYTITVFNYAEDADGNGSGGALCASVDNDDVPSQLSVAPCFLPKIFDGPYWVVAYDATEGYALISGGQPKNVVPDEVGCGGSVNGTCCKTGDGINNSGLWIFSRSPVRDEDMIKKVRAIAKNLGFATSVLFDVDHTDCPDVSEMGGPFGTQQRRRNLAGAEGGLRKSAVVVA